MEAIEDKKISSGEPAPRRKKRSKRRSKGDVVFDVINVTLITIICLILLYPFLYMLSVSVSDYTRVSEVIIFPKGFSLSAYAAIFRMDSILIGYANSFLYTITGVLVNMAMTILCAYPLSKSWMLGKKFLSVLVLITMYFGGGLIPSYLLITNVLHLNETIFAIIIPGAINTYYMIIMRTYFITSIPREIDEACEIDGANQWQTMMRIYMPLSVPILATLSLYYIVIMWNSWFSASLYLSDPNKHPIQLILRNSMATNNIWVGDSNVGDVNYKSLNYALTVAVILPIIITYPFCQKFFVKGVMVGSLKG